MKRLHGYTPAPKKQRIVIFADSRGTFTARATTAGTKDNWAIILCNMKSRGFLPIGQFNLPYRFHLKGNGYTPAIQAFYNWAIHNQPERQA